MSTNRATFLIFTGLMVGIGAIFSIFGEWEKVETASKVVAPVETELVSRSHRVQGDVKEFKNTDLKVSFLGDAGCVNCHVQETESFRKHPMGRSMCKITDFAALPKKEPFVAGNFRYSVETKDKAVIHIEEEIDSSGKVLKKIEKPISLVIGSGTRGNSFLTEKAGFLHQSPISWYTSLKKYDLAPSYQSKNLHFGRQIQEACLFCHSNRPETNHDNSIVLHGLTIGCERCHGPGELHAKEQKLVNGYDPTIVNPAKLSNSRKDDICYQCHIQLEAREEAPGKSLTDFRPGQDIETFITRNKIPIGDPLARFKAVSHVFQMEESRCYIASEGKMSCTSCHNPHDYRNDKDRLAEAIKKCNSCHADKGCSLPMPTRLVKSPADDCIACHMPKRNTVDIGHTPLTDHSIKRLTSAYQTMKQDVQPKQAP